VSVDSLRPPYHDNFRHGRRRVGGCAGRFGGALRRAAHFIVQRRSPGGPRGAGAPGRLVGRAGRRCPSMLFFLVATGRGASLKVIWPPAEYEAVLADLGPVGRSYRGRMLVRAKCAPHFNAARLHQSDPGPPCSTTRRAAPAHAILPRVTPDAKLERVRTRGDLRPRRYGHPRRCARGSWAAKCGRVRVPRAVRWLPGARLRLTGDVLAADPSVRLRTDGVTWL